MVTTQLVQPMPELFTSIRLKILEAGGSQNQKQRDKGIPQTHFLQMSMGFLKHASPFALLPQCFDNLLYTPSKMLALCCSFYKLEHSLLQLVVRQWNGNRAQ